MSAGDGCAAPPVTEPGDEDAFRAIADGIDRSRPDWLVIWGCYTRLFWAYPLFDMRRRMVVHAGYPDALLARMDETERRLRVQPSLRGGAAQAGQEDPRPRGARAHDDANAD
jgi:hypothetical protein